MDKIEVRHKILEAERKKSLEKKKQDQIAKEQYLKQCFDNQLKSQADKVDGLLSSRFKKEKHLKEVYDKREYDHKLKKELELIKREERLENVKRINRANQYAKDQIQKQIENDN